MQYLGGKSKWGRAVVEAIAPWRGGAPWVEPFCGALNVTRWAGGVRIASDGCLPLITTLQAVQRGWEPPDHVPLEEYRRVRAAPDPHNPLTGFVMFGCSYGGKWGAGYVREASGKRSHAYAKRQLLAKMRACADVQLLHRDYRDPHVCVPGAVIYADPPYQGTTDYGAVGSFNSAEFWGWAGWWHSRGALVFVSEGAGAVVPRTWVVYRRWTLPTYLGGGTRGPREERLYVHAGSPMAAVPAQGPDAGGPGEPVH